jgi:hypothetical protein
VKETLIMKHAVGGRIFIDTAKKPMAYKVEEIGGSWTFTVHTAWNEEIEELLRLKEELNVFIFQEPEGQPIEKTWYYVNNGPVVYDADHARLTVVAQSRITYLPHEYLN